MNFEAGLTRRSLLRAGAGAGAAVAIGVRPWAAMAAPAAAGGYLTRAAYAGLEGTSFTVETGGDPVVLRLESVADVAGAATRRSLAGSEDSFALTFSGPLSDPLESGIHTIEHPHLGNIELFASPVDEPGRDRTYEIVVDRSVPEPAARTDAPASREPAPRPDADAPPAPADTAPSPGQATRAQIGAGQSRPARLRRRELLRRRRLRRRAARMQMGRGRRLR
jgi:hypothetical protein